MKLQLSIFGVFLISLVCIVIAGNTENDLLFQISTMALFVSLIAMAVRGIVEALRRSYYDNIVWEARSKIK